MTKPVRSVRVWVPVDDSDAPKIHFHHGYGCYFIEAVPVFQPDAPMRLGSCALATLTLDPPKPKKKGKKR